MYWWFRGNGIGLVCPANACSVHTSADPMYVSALSGIPRQSSGSVLSIPMETSFDVLGAVFVMAKLLF